jgi:hypothetical protein
MILEVKNDGPLITHTNYFGSEHARRGKVFLSINAGTVRLLLPASLEGEIADMRGASEVILSRGPWPAQRRKDALEIMFEDFTDDPWCLHTTPEQWDRLPLDTDGLAGWRLAVWVAGPHLALDLPLRYRRVPSLPWLRPWDDESARRS